MARRSAVAEATVNCVASCGPQIRAQEHGEPQALARRRNPFAPEASATLALRFGEKRPRLSFTLFPAPVFSMTSLVEVVS